MQRNVQSMKELKDNVNEINDNLSRILHGATPNNIRALVHSQDPTLSRLLIVATLAELLNNVQSRHIPRITPSAIMQKLVQRS